MADFRKLFLVLAVMAFAASAFAQSPFVCIGNPAVPATLRGGGLTEEVGDVLLTCSGGVDGGNANGSFQVLMTAPAVTNRIGALVAGQGFPAAGVALTVERGLIGQPNYQLLQVVQGFLNQGIPVDTPAARNVLTFANVMIPTGSQPVNVRISGIRVAAPIVTNTQVPQTVYEYISTSPAQIIPVTNSTQPVGIAYPAVGFEITGCNGSGTPALSFQQCVDFNGGAEPAGALTFAVRFTEGFPTAFKIKDATADTVTNNGEFTGRVWSAGTPVVTVSDVPGANDSATRLIFTLTNVPVGVKIRVTDHQLPTSGAGVTAALVSGANINGVGGAPVTTVSGDTAFCGTQTVSGVTSPAPVAGVGLVDASSSSTTVYAVWEVATQTLGTDSLLFGVEVSFAADPGNGEPGLTGDTPAVPGGNIAPQSSVNYGDATSQIPRFNTPAITKGELVVTPCVTNLLFPYITSTQGYDSGVALVNTSKDNAGSTDIAGPFSTSAQTGACTVFFFGNKDIAPQVTPTVEPGTLVKFTMNNPLAGWADTAGFEGYLIARCNFQYAHGLAFIVDTALPGFGSEAYLALVIPDQAGGGRPPVNFAVNGGAGEQLIH